MKKSLRCRLGLHDLDYSYEDRPHPLTPQVRQNWMYWVCTRCGLQGSDLHDYEANDGTATVTFLIVIGAILLVAAGGVLDAV